MSEFTSVPDGTANAWTWTARPTSLYGGFYAHENAVAKDIRTTGVNNHHLIHEGCATGSVSGITYIDGSAKSITAFAADTIAVSAGTWLADVVTFTTVGHAWIAGDSITVAGCGNAAYNGVYTVVSAATDTWTAALVGDPGAFTTAGTATNLAATVCTCVGHGMSNGYVISIRGSTNYEGIWVIEHVHDDTFVIPDTYVADDGAETADLGSALKVSETGIYLLNYSGSIKPANANDVVEMEAYVNAVEQLNTESQTKLGANTDFQVVTGHGLLSLTANDIVTIGVENLTGANDLTIRNVNVTLVRIHD